MAIEYLGLSGINGPLVVLEGLQGALPTEFLFVMVQAGILSALYGGGLLVLHRGRSERSGAARE